MVLNYDKSKEECFDMLMQTIPIYGKMETGKPVVAAINGLALGEDAK
jgi:3-hydroxyacyl-CoA dehydrogenase/enoyl-CoA hydratase/3-hydroxybutyryl-CoA epimerase